MRYNTDSMKRVLSNFVLWYLRTAAKLQLRKTHPIVIGVAGSSGKSSLARLLQEVLQEKYSVLSGEGKNSETGIPLGILGIKMKNYGPMDWLKTLLLAKWNILTNWKKYDVFIAEMGIDSPVEPKNMSYLLKIVRPSIGMVTNVSLEHSVYFDEYVKASSEEDRQEKILQMTAEQETLLLRSIPPRGTSVVNLDDAFIAASAKDIKAKTLTISLQDKHADLYATHIVSSLKEFSMDIFWREKKYSLQIGQLLPGFYAYEFLFALATALSLDIPLSEGIASLEKHFSLPAGRLSIFDGIKNTTIIDSSYNNATLEPILGILDLLKHISGRRRRLAIIGDMRELGSQSRKAHEELAEKLAESLHEVILIGPLLKNYAVPILKKKRIKFQSFTTFTEAKEAILSAVQEKDVILVKSSQNTLFLERAVEMLLADKNDVDKLCRRGEFWDKKRSETL